MYLFLSREFDYDFILQVVAKLVRHIKINIHKENFIQTDLEINLIPGLKEIISTKEIILSALGKINIVKQSNHYMVEFDPIINYPNTRIKMITLLKLITYGNSQVQGNTVVLDEFKKLNTKLDYLYEMYKNRGIIV